MLSSEVKALISVAVELYSTVPLTQALIDEGTNKLTKAKELLLSQKEEPSEKQYKIWLLNPLFAENLIENASFMSVQLDELKEHITIFGVKESYMNGSNQFGYKESVESKTYNKLIKN